MALLLSPALLITPSSTIPAWYPKIGWDNVVTFASLSATSSATSYPVTNLSTPSTIDRWIGGSAAELLVSVTGIDDTIDYVGIARHNLGSAGIEVSVETLSGDPGAVWTEVFTGVLLGDDAPAVLQFDAAPVIGVRLRLQAGSEAPDIAVLYAGLMLQTEKGLQADFVPIHRALSVEKLNGRTELGDYLGTIITKEALNNSAQFKLLTSSWYEASMAPFVLAANRGRPFFFAWDPDGHGSDVGFCWLTDSAQPRFPMLNKGFIDLSLAMGGIVS